MKHISRLGVSERGGLNIHTFCSSAFGLAANAVLIEGPTEAILVDTFWTIDDAKELASVVKNTGKRLKAVYISHAHPDHYGGIPAFASAFPETPILAHQGVIDGIREWPAKVLHWQDIYGDAMFGEMVLPTEITRELDAVDGRTFRAIKLPPAETVHATAFALPDQKTFIAGDLLFDRTHLYMGDTCNAEQWLEALEFVKREGTYDLCIPGHGGLEGDAFSSTSDWLNVFREVHQPGVHFTKIAQTMYERFPDYGLANMLWVTRGPGFGTYGAAEAGVPPEVLAQ